MTLSIMTLALSLAHAGSPAAPAPAAAPAAAPAPAATAAAPAKPEVAKSTAVPPSPSTVYTAERLRDPFSGIGGGQVLKEFRPEDFNIHALQLRGFMRDGAAEYALFGDPNFGVSFILRRGKLYDHRNRPVKDITGKMKVKEKWAQLQTADGDVQIFRLGRDEE